MTSVEMFDGAAGFLDAAAGWLAIDPVLTTVVSSVAHRHVDAEAAGRGRPDHPQWWMAARDDSGDVVGAAMRAAPFAPYPPYVLPMPDDAAAALARLLVDRGEQVDGVNGALPAVGVFADEIAHLTGRAVQTREHTRLFDLPELIEPTSRPPGTLRAAGPGDAALCADWFRAFAHDVDVAGGRVPEAGSGDHVTLDDVLGRIAEGTVFLWDVDGEITHLTAQSLPAFGVVRVGPVYTPSEHRGRGYAAAAVAQVSRAILDAGHRACLFTDQANPVSNRIYTGLGYRPLIDTVSLRLVRG
ncbi:GNAT family N-acetyltransferase [Nocardioides sp. R-C-SC26]|uniref:GNAT family N-acetyltransferase n=1 Tax=Nocardioides sp. R-C-SC26 TaxID=2870414 RepID=UPI001E305E53|nr:GNAT family N-acetyltransferase [Nocardioides sp. R-C-SC26]